MINESAYFDLEYYAEQVRAVGLGSPKDLAGHYMQTGWRLGLNPHPEFSTNGYLSANPDVWNAEVNPLEHFELWGRAEARKIVSTAKFEALPSSSRIFRRTDWLDLEHYQSQVSDRRFTSRVEGLDHYLQEGWLVGLDPHPAFSTIGYLHDNWDVRDDGIDPITHYVHHGFAEGRAVVDPARFCQPGYTTPDSKWATDLRESLGLYLRHLGIDFEVDSLDIRGDGLAITGEYGWFDADFYLGLYDDVAQASIPALTHFIMAGHREGRFPNAAVSGELALRTDVERVLLARSWSEHSYDHLEDNPTILRSGVSVLAEMIERQMIQRPRVIFTFAHDDYVEHVGGVQLVSAREQVLFDELGATYISIFPYRPRLALSSEQPESFQVRCRIGGVLLDGTFSLQEFASEFLKVLPDHDVVAVVHSVLGHSPEAIVQSLQLLKPMTAIWWVHDYSAHCQNYRLTRNGVNWCNDPAPESQSCQLCTFGSVRGQHLKRVGALIESRDWVFVAPSETAANQSVSGHTPLPKRPIVIPHGVLARTGETREPCSERDKVRIAFVGHPATIKGWNRFIAFVSDAGEYAQHFEFFHFGVENCLVSNVTFVHLRPGPGGKSVATDVLLEHRIDAVMNFVDGKETFNFVTFEAMAAGCCVLTSPRSGNVLAAAAAENLLVQVEDDAAEFDYLGIRDEIRGKRRVEICNFEITGLTPAVLEELFK